jgi:hypothetical protein
LSLAPLRNSPDRRGVRGACLAPHLAASVSSALNKCDTARIPGASALELPMAVPGRALYCVALVRAQHTLSMLMQAFSTA